MSHSPAASHALAHHFEDLEQQHEAANLGMWTFLATEVMFFGGLFTSFIVYHIAYGHAFHQASLELNWLIGTLNTAVLLGSSLSMAIAVRAAQLSQRKAAINMILLTAFFATVFLGVKAFEYYSKVSHNLLPGPGFHWHLEHDAAHHLAQVDPAWMEHARVFFSFYFVMTGLHAAHMVIGVGYMLFLVARLRKGRMLGDEATPVEMTGLYWHFVDIVWLFLFPLLYLIDRT